MDTRPPEGRMTATSGDVVGEAVHGGGVVEEGGGESGGRKKAALWRRLLVGRDLRLTLSRVAVWGVATVLTCKFAFLPMWIRGVSMEPTYHDGAFTFVNRLAYLEEGPRRGDVVAIRYQGEKAMFMKRIIGMPGEEVRFEANVVYIDGEALDEPYVKNRVGPPKRRADPRPWTKDFGKLGADEYFVVGDNRGMHQYQHLMGTTTREDIVGKILF